MHAFKFTLEVFADTRMMDVTEIARQLRLVADRFEQRRFVSKACVEQAQRCLAVVTVQDASAPVGSPVRQWEVIR